MQKKNILIIMVTISWFTQFRNAYMKELQNQIIEKTDMRNNKPRNEKKN